MTLLAVLVTHLEAPGVEASLGNLTACLPARSRIVVAHGGRRADYEAVDWPDKLFAEDPGLRGPPATHQSYTEILLDTYRLVVARDAAIEHVLVIEFDQVALRADFGHRLIDLFNVTEADFVGKTCIDRTATNWWHRVRFRDDPGLMRFLASISVRADPTRIYGCLGSGFIMRRGVLEAFSRVAHVEGVYNELYIPTVAHHLGFRLADVDASSDIYRAVRSAPAYSLSEAARLQAEGAYVVHPFKDLRQLGSLRPPAA